MHTPALDAFANRSMVFLRSYCQQAICMASRASLLTGRRPDTTGVTTALGSYWRKAGGNFTSLPEHFKNHGYVAVGHGKSAWPACTRILLTHCITRMRPHRLTEIMPACSS
jgi:iduronate 2-sulfatase